MGLENRDWRPGWWHDDVMVALLSLSSRGGVFVEGYGRC